MQRHTLRVPYQTYFEVYFLCFIIKRILWSHIQASIFVQFTPEWIDSFEATFNPLSIGRLRIALAALIFPEISRFAACQTSIFGTKLNFYLENTGSSHARMWSHNWLIGVDGKPDEWSKRTPCNPFLKRQLMRRSNWFLHGSNAIMHNKLAF